MFSELSFVSFCELRTVLLVRGLDYFQSDTILRTARVLTVQEWGLVMVMYINDDFRTVGCSVHNQGAPSVLDW